MSKSRQHKASRQSATTKPTRVRVMAAPDIPVIVMAAVGVLLTAYLSVVAFTGSQALFCSAESACDVIQQSVYSRLFGIPVALFGFILYAIIVATAWIPTTRLKRWRRLWTLSLIGLAVSVYLTLVAAFMLKATCAWCLASLLLMTAIFVWVTVKRPESAPGLPWRVWLLNYSAIFVAIMLGMGLAQSGLLSLAPDPRVAALAEHLRDSGARYYGASWCATCQEQSRRFGDAARNLPYVECSLTGRNDGQVAQACAAAGVEVFPTWTIRGQRHQGLIEPRELARLSRFPWDPQPTAE